MANLIEKTDINSNKFVNLTSRYANQELIYYTEKKIITYPLYKKQKTMDSTKDKFALITKKYEFRPDLLSFEFYGTPDFWWKIMETNDINDIIDFKIGLSVKLPSTIL